MRRDRIRCHCDCNAVVNFVVAVAAFRNIRIVLFVAVVGVVDIHGTAGTGC